METFSSEPVLQDPKKSERSLQILQSTKILQSTCEQQWLRPSDFGKAGSFTSPPAARKWFISWICSPVMLPYNYSGAWETRGHLYCWWMTFTTCLLALLTAQLIWMMLAEALFRHSVPPFLGQPRSTKHLHLPLLCIRFWRMYASLERKPLPKQRDSECQVYQCSHHLPRQSNFRSL